MWRIATHPRSNDSITTIRKEWTMADVWEANVVFNAIDRAERIAREKAEDDAKRKK